jgi:hypothetical protein
VAGVLFVSDAPFAAVSRGGRSGPMRGAWIVGVAGSCLASAASTAAVVGVTGDLTLAPSGTGAVLTPGAGGAFATVLTPFSASGENIEISGVVRARSTVRDLGGGVVEQAMDLAWQELRVVTSALHEINFTVGMQQQFQIAPMFVGNEASFNSFASNTNVRFAGAGQMASWTRTRSDSGAVSDVTISRTRTSTLGGTTLFDGLAGFGASRAGLAPLYTMNMTLSFTLSPNGQVMTFTDTGGPTVATLVMVPMTSAAWAGAAGLMVAGAVVVRRRRGM